MEVWKGFWFSGCQYKMSVSKTVFVESFHFHFDENLHFIFSNFYFSVFNRKSSASSVKSADHRGELVKELRWHYKQYMKTARQNKEKLSNVSVVSRKVKGNLIFLHELNQIHVVLRCVTRKCYENLIWKEKTAELNYV